MTDVVEATRRVHQELDGVRQVKKCVGCECLLDVLEAVRGDLTGVAGTEAEAARGDMSRWLEGNPKRHRCLGCEVCLPIAPYNRFSASLKEGTGQQTATPARGAPACSCGEACATEPVRAELPTKWPVLEGDYLVGDPMASVAICTLADVDLPSEIRAAGLLGRVAIVGTLSTENLGVDRVVRNVVANPGIGCLVLCGRDSRGHRAGQALLALKANGLDDSLRIVGALGPRPVLKNVSAGEIAAFRERVNVLDEIGTRDSARLAAVIERCLAEPSGGTPIPLPRVQLAKVEEAERPTNREWVHDPEGFFVVLLDRDTRTIVCEHYTEGGTLNEVVRGKSAADIGNTAIKRGLVSRLDHAAYLGRELAKAETALALGVTYTQDQPLPQPSPEGGERLLAEE